MIRALPPVGNHFWNNSFSKNMQRLLNACLAANLLTAKKTFLAVDGSHLDLEIHFDDGQNNWRIDAKLFDTAALHNLPWVPCGCNQDFDTTPDVINDENVSLCHQSVEPIIESMIDQLPAGLFMSLQDANVKATGKEVKDQKRAMIAKAYELLRWVPLAVGVEQTDIARELKVSWDSAGLPAHFKQSIGMWRVVLHRNDPCNLKQDAFLSNDGKYPRQFDRIVRLTFLDPDCECPRQDVSLDAQSCIFQDLDESLKYFSMVSRATSGAIFGVSPTAIQPLAPSEDEVMDDSPSEVDDPVDDGSPIGAVSTNTAPPAPMPGSPSRDSHGLPDRTQTTGT